MMNPIVENVARPFIGMEYISVIIIIVFASSFLIPKLYNIFRRKRKIVFTRMYCKKTNKMEDQIKIKSSEEGIYLECMGCKNIKGYEIGFFADKFMENEKK